MYIRTNHAKKSATHLSSRAWSARGGLRAIVLPAQQFQQIGESPPSAAPRLCSAAWCCADRAPACFSLRKVIFRCCFGQRVNVVAVDPIGSGRRPRVRIPVRAADPINGWLPRHWINILAVDVEPWGAARGIVVHVCRHACSPRLATRAATKHRESPWPEVLIHDQKSSTRMPQSATLPSSTDHSEGFRPSTRPSPTT